MYSDYISYMKKKTSMHEYFKISLNTEIDLLKYEYVQSKLKQALNDNSIDEKRWQEELMPIILLLYPRYIICLKNVKIKRTNNKDKEIDYLLVDAEGNTMILKLKKPFSDKKLLTNAYRKNFYQPKFELAGGIQQIESYIYDLNYDKKRKYSDNKQRI